MRIRTAAALVLAGAAFAVPAAPARAAACASSSGVTVVVDFASLGGGTQRECAPGDPGSGLAALRAAGFTPTRAAQEPGYFLCRINGKPANDPCQRTSPANAYWSYWHAKPGGSWTYSSIGPADYDPAPGTVEGWAFGGGKPPSSAPPPAAAPSPPPSPTAVRSAPAPGPTHARRTAAAATSAAPTPAAATSQLAASSSPSNTAPPSATPAPGTPVADPPPGTVKSRPNKYAGPVVAALLVLLITAAGVRRLRLRRKSEEA